MKTIILVFFSLSIIIANSVNAKINICGKIASEFKIENKKVNTVQIDSDLSIMIDDLSEDIDTEYDINSEENPSWVNNVTWLKWEPIKISTDDYYGPVEIIATANEKINKFHIVLIIELHSWRGYIYRTYLIPNDQFSGFINKVQTINDISELRFNNYNAVKVFPTKDNFAWNFRNIFVYDDKFYYLGRDGWEKDKFNITEINNNSTNILCKFDNNVVYKEKFTFLKLFGSLLNKISGCGYDVACKGSIGDINCWYDGENYIERLTTRKLKPWLIKKEDLQNYNKWLDGSFLRLYSYTDIWTNRLYETVKSVIPLAKNELKNILVNYYHYEDLAAETLAIHYIADILSSIVGGHHGRGPDFLYKGDDYNGNAKTDINNWLISQQVALETGKYDLIKSYNFYWYETYSFKNTDSLSLLIDHFEFFNDKELFNLIHNKNSNIIHKNLMMYATHINNFNAVKELSNHIDVNETTRTNPDDESCSNISSNNRNALTYACENASKELIGFLVQKGSNVQILDTKSRSLDYYLNKNPYLTENEKKKGMDFLKELRHIDLSMVNPSFDCKKASNRFERAICSSDTLSNYDKSMSILYNKLKPTDVFEVIKKSQKEWLSGLRNGSKDEMSEQEYKAYLARAIRNRTYFLQKIYEHINGKTLF